MKARFGIAALAAAWLARGGSSDAGEETARASAEAAVVVASARVAPGRTTTVGPAIPRLELPVEPPALVDSNPELPAADPRAIHGAIYELGGDPCVGATVVATSPALKGEQVVISDEDGRYYIGGLPPGEYTLVVYYNNESLSVAGFEVRDDAATLAELVFDPLPEPAREVVESPSIEVYVAQTLPLETYENNVPTGRDFTGAFDCTGDDCTIHSNCGSENTYIIDNDSADESISSDSHHEGITIDKDYIKSIPVPGRTFGAVLGAAAGSQPGG